MMLPDLVTAVRIFPIGNSFRFITNAKVMNNLELMRLKLGEKFGNGEEWILWIGGKLVTLHTFTPHNQYHGDDDDNQYLYTENLPNLN